MEMRRNLALLSLLFVILYGCKQEDPSSSTSDLPTILTVTPSQVMTGEKDVDGSIRGSNFTGIVAVDMGSGVQVKKTELVNSTELSVRFDVLPEASAGPQTVRVTTLAGSATKPEAFSISDNRLPVASFNYSPKKAGIQSPVEFDASTSSDPDGSIRDFAWDFGDEQKGSGTVVTHKYSSSGNFKVTLTVTDDRNGTSAAEKTLAVDASRPPVPHFKWSPLNGDVNTVFRFDGSGSTDDKRVTEYKWDFGDGKKDTGKIAHHQYSVSGDFPVTLTVQDAGGLENSLTKDLGVKGFSPVASFLTTPSSGPSTTVFQFDASGSSDPDGKIVDYSWEMGDGTGKAGVKVQHKYSQNGTYPVRLTVEDNGGLRDSTVHNLQVMNIPSGGVRCTQPVPLSKPKPPDWYGTIVSEDRASRTVVVQLYQNATCKDVFYYCGDIRLGGDPNPPEYWLGTICEMYYLGNNTFRVHLVKGNFWPSAGQKNVYLHWQDCGGGFCP